MALDPKSTPTGGGPEPQDPPGPTFVPLYQQVRDILMHRIASGAWRPGSPLPSEPRLAAELNVSLGTVRKALDELVSGRLVVRQQGRGTFVAEQTPDTALFHFFRVVDTAGERVIPNHRELHRDCGPATEQEAARLSLTTASEVLRLRRLRSANGRTALLERICIATDLVPGLADHEGPLPNTLYDLYQQRFGLTIRRAGETLRAEAADRESATLLGLDVGAPVLAIDRVAYGFEDRPVEWRVSLLDTRHFAYANEIE